MKEWIVTFAYSGSSKREFFDKIFQVGHGDNIEQMISNYVYEQNRGEAKSDKIRYWSKKLKPITP